MERVIGKVYVWWGRVEFHIGDLDVSQDLSFRFKRLYGDRFDIILHNYTNCLILKHDIGYFVFGHSRGIRGKMIIDSCISACERQGVHYEIVKGCGAGYANWDKHLKTIGYK